MTDRRLTLAERDALHQKLNSPKAEASVIEERVAQAIHERLNAIVHGGTTMVINDERTRRMFMDIVEDVLSKEIKPLPFTVTIDMETDRNRVQVNFAYPLRPTP
jgi:hypothetical protein